MEESRSDAASVSLPDSRVLVVGGMSERGLLASAEVFGPNGTFSRISPMHFARRSHTATVLGDGRVLVAGGETLAEGPTNSAEIYDPASDTWTIVNSLTEARAGHTATLLPDGRVLTAGGWSSSGARASLEIFDPETESFIYAGAMSSPRRDHAATALADGRVLLVGGTDGTAILASAEIYDPASGLVSGAADLSQPRGGHSATALLNGSVLVAGGDGAEGELSSAEVYDPATNQWSPAGNLAAPRRGHLAFLLPHNNNVLITGGTSAGTPAATAELFASWRGEFTSTGSPAEARAGAAGSALAQDGLLVVAGGSGLASGELYAFATIKTDKQDYAPGESVAVSGSGWQPGEAVRLVLQEEPSLQPARVIRTVADESGTIANERFSPNPRDAGVTFYLTATGLSSRLEAQTRFTDKNPSTTTVTSSLNPSVFGQSVTFTATVQGSGSRKTPSGKVQFKIDGANFGAAVSLSKCGARGVVCAKITTSSLTAGTHTVEGVYSGDKQYLSSSGTLSGGQTVNKASTATTLTSSVNPSGLGESVTFTATVAAQAPGRGIPTGTVTFRDGSTTIGTGTLNTSGWTTFSTTSLSEGAHSITAVYEGDGNFNGSTSAALVQSVGKSASATALTSSLNPSNLGDSVTFTATVTPWLGENNEIRPTGTISFFDGATALALNVPLTDEAWASFTTSNLSVGTHGITAVYSGDANFQGSTSNTVSQIVNQFASATALTSSLNPSNRIDSVTFTATVTPWLGSNNEIRPTGTISFFDGATALALNVPLTVEAWASFTTSNLSAGTHAITAVYSGDANFQGSTSNTVSQVVNQVASTTALTSSLNPSNLGDSVTFTATVTPWLGVNNEIRPTGTISFFDGGTPLAANVPLTAEAWAVITTNSLAVGTHSITAVYSGDANFQGSTSNTLIQSVSSISQVASTTALTSSLNPSSLGNSVTFTATVTPWLGEIRPTGTISFFDGGTPLAVNVPLTDEAWAIFTTSNLSVGTHSITAVYSGDANFQGSASNALSQTVNPVASGTVLISSLNPSNLGESVTFTATVTPWLGVNNEIRPTGTISFFDGETPLAVNVPLTAESWAVFSTSSLAIGTHFITAVYSGDANFQGSGSSVLIQSVNQVATTTALTSNLNPANPGAFVTFTATVTPWVGANGEIRPTGTISFFDGASALALNVPLTDEAWAIFTTSNLSVGTHSITAVYSGDSNFTSSTSAVLTQSVQ